MTWFMNRNELVSHIEKQGMRLVREFAQSGIGRAHRAPEQGQFRGFLFQRVS
jgi:hypothetical protein